jgi:uncharacterized protein (TIGR02147 family)
MNSVFSCIDYRSYIADYYQAKKNSGRTFSYRAFSQKAGFKSPVFIKLVIDGKANLSRQSAEQLGRAMELDEEELIYFCMLVDFNQARKDDKKRDLFFKLQKYTSRLKIQVVDEDRYAYYEKWYFSALRELVTFAPWGDDYALLGSCLEPALGKREVKKALTLLEEKGFIKKNSQGKYVQTSKNISTGSDVSSLAVRNYHKIMGHKAVESVDETAREERDFSGLTMGVSEQCLSVLKEELSAFRQRVRQIVADDNEAERVYRLNLQLFPLSNNTAHGKGKRGRKKG